MADISVEQSLSKLPEFKALGAVYAALLPLDAEGRRKVIEAIHALLKVSAGREQGLDQKRRGAKTSRRRS